MKLQHNTIVKRLKSASGQWSTVRAYPGFYSIKRITKAFLLHIDGMLVQISLYTPGRGGTMRVKCLA